LFLLFIYTELIIFQDNTKRTSSKVFLDALLLVL
jgi:hypothetical protein